MTPFCISNEILSISAQTACIGRAWQHNAASGEVPVVAVNVASPEMPREVLQEQTKNPAPLPATRQVGRKLRLHIAGKSYEVEIEEVK